MVHLRLVEKGAGPERVAVVGEVGEVGRQRPATGQSGRGRVRPRGGIGRSRRSRRGRRVRRHRRPSPPRRIGAPPATGPWFQFWGAPGFQLGRPPRGRFAATWARAPTGRGRAAPGRSTRPRPRGCFARVGSGTQNPRARAEARRGARTSPRARASPVPRFVVAFPEAGGSASDAGGKREDGDARVVARRGDGETEGAERGTRDEPWSRARSAPGLAPRLARARALRRRHSALLITRERARFLSGEKGRVVEASAGSEGRASRDRRREKKGGGAPWSSATPSCS